MDAAERLRPTCLGDAGRESHIANEEVGKAECLLASSHFPFIATGTRAIIPKTFTLISMRIHSWQLQNCRCVFSAIKMYLPYCICLLPVLGHFFALTSLVLMVSASSFAGETPLPTHALLILLCVLPLRAIISFAELKSDVNQVQSG